MAELNLLQEKILSDGVIRPGNVLKVDSFLNHQIDVPFISELGKEFKKLFGDRKVDKILTIEASGIGIACLTEVIRGNYGNASAYATILTVTSILSLLLFYKVTGRRDVSV